MKNSAKEKDGEWKVYRHWIINDQGVEKSYIGITSQSLEQRWRKGNGYKKNSYFYKAILKYGWDNFNHEILKNNLSYNQADFYEKFFIYLFKSNNKKYGYNMTSGGEVSFLTEESKKKISEKNKGKKRTQEIKNKLKKQRQGRNACGWGYFPNEESKKLVSKKLKGIERSKETKEKLKKSHSKEVYQYDLNGNFIKKWDSCLEVSRELGFNRSNINSNKLYQTKTSHGFCWLNDYIENKELIKNFINGKILIPPITKNKCRKVIQYNETKTKILGIYSSIKKASQITKIPSQQIILSCQKGSITTNYYWKYFDLKYYPNYFEYYANNQEDILVKQMKDEINYE